MPAKGVTKCIHIEEVDEKISGNTKRMSGMRKNWSVMGSPSTLSNVRTCWMLRFFCEYTWNYSHFNQTKHPVIKSYEPGEKWKWCYVDEVFIK